MGTGVKLQAREADHLPQSSSEVKNGGTVSPLPHISSWRGVYSSKLTDNFTFTCTSIFVFIAVIMLYLIVSIY
jgi:hypothetical protein